MLSKNNMILLFLIIFVSKTIFVQSQSKPTQETFSPNIIIIPFKTFYQNNKNNKSPFSSSDYYSQIHLSKIYLQMESKTGQNLHVYVSTDESAFYIDDYYSDLGKNKCPYSSQLSPSYHLCNNYSLSYEDYNIDKSICAKDKFKLYTDYSLEKYDLLSIEFQHYKDKDRDVTFSCGKTGLKLPSYNINKKGNFISQIHDKVDNVDYSFSFKYTNNEDAKNINELNEGLFVIGIQSYEKKKNVEMESIYVSQLTFGRAIGWKFDIYNIFIGNRYFDFDELDIEVNPDIDGMEITYDFFSKLNEYFFQTYYDKGICVNEKINFERNIVVYCYADKFKQNDIDNFPELNFFKNQINYNFTFTGNDLFQEINGKIFFKIITNIEIYKKDIIFGKLFLKKYQVIFNSDYKSISFYKEVNINKLQINNNKSNNTLNFNSNKKEKILKSILFIFIGILILVFGIFLGKKYFNIKRRIYANELEDSDYVYEPKKMKDKDSKEHILVDV